MWYFVLSTKDADAVNWEVGGFSMFTLFPDLFKHASSRIKNEYSIFIQQTSQDLEEYCLKNEGRKEIFKQEEMIEYFVALPISASKSSTSSPACSRRSFSIIPYLNRSKYIYYSTQIRECTAD